MKRARFQEILSNTRKRKRTCRKWLQLVQSFKADANKELAHNCHFMLAEPICPKATLQSFTASTNYTQDVFSCPCCKVYLWTCANGIIYCGDKEYKTDYKGFWPWTAQERGAPYMPKDVVLLIVRYACMDFQSMLLVCKQWKEWIYGCKTTRMAVQQRLIDKGFYIPTCDVPALCVQFIPTEGKTPLKQFKSIKARFRLTVVHAAFVLGRKAVSVGTPTCGPEFKHRYTILFQNKNDRILWIFMQKKKNSFQVSWGSSELSKRIGYGKVIGRWNDIVRGYDNRGMISHWKTKP